MQACLVTGRHSKTKFVHGFPALEVWETRDTHVGGLVAPASIPLPPWPQTSVDETKAPHEDGDATTTFRLIVKARLALEQCLYNVIMLLLLSLTLTPVLHLAEALGKYKPMVDSIGNSPSSEDSKNSMNSYRSDRFVHLKYSHFGMGNTWK